MSTLVGGDHCRFNWLLAKGLPGGNLSAQELRVLTGGEGLGTAPSFPHTASSSSKDVGLSATEPEFEKFYFLNLYFWYFVFA